MNGRNERIWAHASGFGVLVAGALALAIPSRVAAGPIELFTSVEVASARPERVVARWINGDGGIFISDDAAASFGMTCYTVASPDVMGRNVQAFKTAPDGSQCVGTVSQMFCSNAEGCGWTEVTELKGQWISDFAEDPKDKKRLYLATGTAEGENGVWVREEPGAEWKPLGTQLNAWFSRLFVVPNGDGRRFYASSQESVTEPGPDGGMPITVPKYFIRYSDDDGATWTSHYYGTVPERTNLRLVGVDPSNIDRILVLLVRSGEGLTDELYYSDKRGEPGSYVKVGTVTAFSQATFMPDGTLWYGDNDQMTPGLYKVAKLGEAPVKVTGSYKVGCVNYDAPSKRLYVCADWRLGTADPETGELTTLFDIRMADKLHQCSGEGPTNERCGVALKSPNFCDITHYPGSPVCMKYFGTKAWDDAGAGGAAGASAGAGGMSIAAGAGGASGAAGTGTAGGGGDDEPGTGGTKAGAKSKDSGCSVPAVGLNHSSTGAWLGLGLALAAVLRRRRPRAAARGS